MFVPVRMTGPGETTLRRRALRELWLCITLLYVQVATLEEYQFNKTQGHLQFHGGTDIISSLATYIPQ